MDEYIKLQKEILATLHRLEKNGTFTKFFEDIPEHSIGYDDYIPALIDSDNAYKEMKERCATIAADFLHQAEVNLGKTKAYLSHTDKVYQGYNSKYRKYIKNESILKFLEDYESDHKK